MSEKICITVKMEYTYKPEHYPKEVKTAAQAARFDQQAFTKNPEALADMMANDDYVLTVEPVTQDHEGTA